MKKDILEAQIENLEQSVESKKRYIEQTSSVIDAKQKELAELESEKSAAEKFAGNYDFCAHDYMQDDVRESFEAGQAHATAATHEIYKPLVDTVKRAVPFMSPPRQNAIEEHLNNLNQPAQEEKPEIVGHIQSQRIMSHGYDTVTFVVIGGIINLGVINPEKKYKLIPMED